MTAKMQRLEVVRPGVSEFLRHFSVPKAIPTQPARESSIMQSDGGEGRPAVVALVWEDEEEGQQ